MDDWDEVDPEVLLGLLGAAGLRLGFFFELDFIIIIIEALSKQTKKVVYAMVYRVFHY